MATETQPAKQAKLLVVEDDVLVRMLLADMVGELGYTVAAEAASIDEALEATRKTDFDLAILDADLKGRSVSPTSLCFPLVAVVTGNFLHEHHDPAPHGGIINSHERSDQP